MVLRPEVIFNDNTKQLCKRAIEDFLESGAVCNFIDPTTGEGCVNTKRGHAKGHQSSNGTLLTPGLFVAGPFDSAHFEKAVHEEITAFLFEIKAVNGDDNERQNFAVKRHLEALRSAADLNFWYRISGTKTEVTSGANVITRFVMLLFGRFASGRSTTCFGCLFGRIEYKLPCGHYLCFHCIRDFNQSRDNEDSPDTVVLRRCVLCGDQGHENNWPIRVKMRPRLSGLRVLSLDGGGVRGIVELMVLKRIEDAIGLSLPIGEFFDFMAGTSAGRYCTSIRNQL